MIHDEDRDLKAAFQALGNHVNDGATPFDQLASPEALESSRRRRRIRQGATAVTIVLAGLVALQVRPDPAIDYEAFAARTGFELSAVTWEAPSDFLLDVPGRDLLEHVPTIDVHVPLFVPDSTPRLLPNDSQRRSRS